MYTSVFLSACLETRILIYSGMSFLESNLVQVDCVGFNKKWWTPVHIVDSLIAFQKLKPLPERLQFQFASWLLFMHLSTFSSFPIAYVTVRF